MEFFRAQCRDVFADRGRGSKPRRFDARYVDKVFRFVTLLYDKIVPVAVRAHARERRDRFPERNVFQHRRCLFRDFIEPVAADGRIEFPLRRGRSDKHVSVRRGRDENALARRRRHGEHRMPHEWRRDLIQ